MAIDYNNDKLWTLARIVLTIDGEKCSKPSNPISFTSGIYNGKFICTNINTIRVSVDSKEILEKINGFSIIDDKGYTILKNNKIKLNIGNDINWSLPLEVRLYSGNLTIFAED